MQFSPSPQLPRLLPGVALAAAALVTGPTALAQSGLNGNHEVDPDTAFDEDQFDDDLGEFDEDYDLLEPLDGRRDMYAPIRNDDARWIVHPITAPNYSDDGYITTDVRATYMYQSFPDDPATEGQARIYDLQVRYAVREDLQFLVSKIGNVDIHLGPSDTHSGNDLAVAVKYAPLQDWDNDRHLAIGLGYELGIGAQSPFVGDDELRLFGAYSQGFGRSNFGISGNVIFATDGSDRHGETDRLSLHAHYDYTINEYISPVVELNWYHVLDEGDLASGTGSSLNGMDLGSFSTDSADDVITLGAGAEMRPMTALALRAAYELPLTDDDDLIDYRITVSLLWRF